MASSLCSKGRAAEPAFLAQTVKEQLCFCLLRLRSVTRGTLSAPLLPHHEIRLRDMSEMHSFDTLLPSRTPLGITLSNANVSVNHLELIRAQNVLGLFQAGLAFAFLSPNLDSLF